VVCGCCNGLLVVVAIAVPQHPTYNRMLRQLPLFKAALEHQIGERGDHKICRDAANKEAGGGLRAKVAALVCRTRTTSPLPTVPG
jgi:hypothetical protein